MLLSTSAAAESVTRPGKHVSCDHKINTLVLTGETGRLGGVSHIIQFLRDKGVYELMNF